MGKLTPLFNKCLIELVNEYEGIYNPDTDSDIQCGILREAHIVDDHVTTSTGYLIDNADEYTALLEELVGKTVYWEQYGEAGNIIKQVFKTDNGEVTKSFALVPYYRLIAVEDK